MELLHSCRDQALQYYGDLLLAAEKTLGDKLYQQSDASTNNDDQRRYYDAMQQLQRQSSVMHRVFHRELVNHYQHFIDGTDIEHGPEERFDADNLSLVKRDVLEDELAISVIVSRSNSRNSEPLWKLNRRLAALRGGQKVSDETNPFGPARICNAMQIAVAELSLDNRTRIFIYKHLGKIFVLSFSKILAVLNGSLSEHGILPNLRFTAAKPVPQATPQAGGTVDSVDSGASITQQRTLFNAILNLQAQQGANRSETATGVNYSGVAIDGQGQESFSPIDYALALSAMQQSKVFLAAAKLNKTLQIGTVESKLFAQLAHQGNPNSRHKMTTSDANTIDLVGMIFRYMLDEPKLNNSVKSILSHLHTPFLKLALMDPLFLENYQHSARRLLNMMADLGGRWVKSDSDRQVLPKIKMTVETILREFIDDDTMFDPLLEEFTTFKESLEKRSKIVERRNSESQQGQERLAVAKLRAATEFSERLNKSAVTSAIAAPLQKTCEDFLSYNLLRHGERAPSWQSALDVVDRIVESVGEKTTISTDRDAQQRQSELENSLSRALSTMGYDNQAAEDLLRSLRAARDLSHALTQKQSPEQRTPATDYAKPATAATEPASETEIANRATATTAPEPSTAPAQTEPLDPVASAASTAPSKLAISSAATTNSATVVIDHSNTELANPELTKMMQRLTEIAFGTWFEFSEDGIVYPLKLAWYSGVTSRYMFVDAGGVQQRIKTQLEVAKGLTAGHIVIAEPNKKPFMERALATILKSMRRQP